MRCVIKYMEDRFPPLLRMSLHDAPHRRMHVATIQQYREDLRIALTKIGVKTPITVPIDLEIAFVNPSTPDLGNAYLALEQAMDGKTLKGPGIVADDSLISKVTMFKFFTEKPKK